MQVFVKNSLFFAYHGVFAEENILGNWFIVDCFVDIELAQKVNDLEDTFNYAILFDIIRRQMQNTQNLLETVAQLIEAEVKSSTTQAAGIDITITKVNPPISTINGSVGVRLKRNF
jgi:7,8-dihydroneopterin aldolase/epimerase/oxygenase